MFHQSSKYVHFSAVTPAYTHSLKWYNSLIFNGGHRILGFFFFPFLSKALKSNVHFVPCCKGQYTWREEQLSFLVNGHCSWFWSAILSPMSPMQQKLSTFRFLSSVFVPIIKLKPTGKDQALERSIITASTG